MTLWQHLIYIFLYRVVTQRILLQVFDASNYISFIYDDDKTLHPVVSCEEGLIKNNPDR